MFYLLKKLGIGQVEEGDQVMVLADFSGVPAGTKGIITKVHKDGFDVEYDVDGDDVLHADRFSADEIEYLGFATKTHPWRGENTPRKEDHES